MRKFLRREYLADYAALAYVAAYYGWLCVRTPGTSSAALLGEITFYPLGLAVGWAYLRNARIAEADRRTRAAWAILGTGALTLWLVGNTWPRVINFFGTSAFPSWVGYLEIVQHLLLIAAFLTFPGRRLTRRDRPRFAADIGLILVAGFALAFHYGVRVFQRPSPASPPEIAAAQMFLDWAVFVIGAVGVLQKRDAITRGALLFLLVANTLYLSANYVLSGMALYRMGDAVDGIWFAAWVFRWIAARFAWHRYREARLAGEPGTAVPVTTFRSGVFSYVLVAGAFALLIARVVSGDREYLEVVVFSAALMAGLLLARQVSELRENRRLFESQLAQEARFRSFVQNSSDIVLVADGQGYVTYVSPSAARVLGEGAVQPGAQLADLLPPDGATALAPLFAREAHAATRCQTRMQTATGEWRDVEVVATDLRADPAVGGVVLNCRDVTERNELGRQLNQAQKLDAVGHLAGGLAHDFNNVLTAIRGYTELLREDLPQTSTAATDLNYIEQAVDRAAAVTKKLLAFSRKQAVQRVVLDLNTVLLDLHPLLRQLLTDRIDVRTDLDPGLWRIRADQGQMEQVVINLATNARDAMPNGGWLQIGTANRTIASASPETGSLPPGGYVALVVSDQGIGMQPEVCARIFEPFYSTKPKDRGIGLGLAMVHGIVAHSGGHITVESVAGHGTTFTVLLPRTSEAVDSPGTAVPLPLPSGQARRVLLVDDELGVRTIARRMLERAGFDVVEASNGQEALTLLTREHVVVDLLLTDMVMPGLHGRDLIARFRALRPGVPIVCITGFAGEAPDTGEHAGGIAAVVTKPFSSDVLLRALAAAGATPRPGAVGE